MPIASRSTRSRAAAAAQPPTEKENSGRGSVTTPSRKARHRLTTAELSRLESMFAEQTHPSKHQKEQLAAQLGMDLKTITIWFQNKRQTSKRGQPMRSSARTRTDSCLRAVSSPSHNATLDAFEGPAMAPATSGASKSAAEGLNAVAHKAMGKIRPLIDSLNALTSRSPSREHESPKAIDEASAANDAGPAQTQSKNLIVSTEINEHDQTADQDHRTERQTVKNRRIRTLEWACERQSKRRKLTTKEGYLGLSSEEPRDGESSVHTDSALSLLSLASTTPPNDVVSGASLLLSFKHSWRRKEQV